MTSTVFAEHNREQQDYFESTLKQTMIPRASRYIERQVQEVLRFAQIAPQDHVLEVGCGMGRYTLPIARRGVKVSGLDLSPVLLERLREFNREGVEIPLYCADISNPPLELVGSFDVVIGFFALHHFHSLEECFAGMARMLKPGGRVVFLEPNAFNPLYYLQILLTPRMSLRGEKGLTDMRTSVVFPAMQRAGLQRPAVARFGFFPPFIANQDWGARLESILENVSLWQSLLPFQLFRGERS